MLVSDLIELLEKDKITELNSSHFSQEFNKHELSQFQYALALSESVKYIELGIKLILHYGNR